MAPSPPSLDADSPPPGPIGSAPPGPKRKRDKSDVVSTACVECRKKRTKCDGLRPCCTRCLSQPGLQCVYIVPTKVPKEDLRRQVEQLEKYRRSSETIFSDLTGATDRSPEILVRLQAGETVESISSWLDANRAGSATTGGFARRASSISYGSPTVYSDTSPTAMRTNLPAYKPDSASRTFAPLLLPPRAYSIGISSSTFLDEPKIYERSDDWPYPQDLYGRLSPDGQAMMNSTRQWTSVTQNKQLIVHLLSLYFCWEYPTFASLSKEHFIKDFVSGSDTFCSAMLVNAMVALGSRFSDLEDSRASFGDPGTVGDSFFREAQRQCESQVDKHDLTTIQAMGLMSIREASCGRDSESWYYAGQSMRLALEMRLHEHDSEDLTLDPDMTAVRLSTFWGAYALDHAWSLATGSLPQCSETMAVPPKPLVGDLSDDTAWIPYTDHGINRDTTDGYVQPSNNRSVFKCLCELSEIVHKALYLMHNPSKPLNSRSIIALHTQYVAWQADLPMVLRQGTNSTPAMLFAHVYHQFAILLLFRPLMKLRIPGSTLVPREVCLQAADEMQRFLRVYQNLYGLKRTPSLVPYILLSGVIMHLAVSATPSAKGHSATSSKSPDVRDTSVHEGELRRKHEDPIREEIRLQTRARMGARAAQAILVGIDDLSEMRQCHPFADQALNVIHYLAQKWNIKLEGGKSKATDASLQSLAQIASQRMLDVQASLSRPPRGEPVEFGTRDCQQYAPASNTFTLSSTPSALSYLHNFISEFGPRANSRAYSFPHTTSSSQASASRQETARLRAEEVEEAVSWPFSLAGRPSIETLREAGFELAD